MDKYVGQRVEIIYLSRQQQFSQRTIRMVSVRNGKVWAYDEAKRQLRSFRAESILAIRQVSRHAS